MLSCSSLLSGMLSPMVNRGTVLPIGLHGMESRRYEIWNHGGMRYGIMEV